MISIELLTVRPVSHEDAIAASKLHNFNHRIIQIGILCIFDSESEVAGHSRLK